MKKLIGCKFLGTHQYYIQSEEPKCDAKGNVIGKIIISRCSICGNIKAVTIYTEENYGR